MGKLLFPFYGEVHTAPKKPGIALADMAEGSIVKLNENGSPVEFYVAKHDYESALNGAGRTLLVRKDCYDQRQWHSSNVNAYASCSLDSWFNGDYKDLLDEAVQTAIGTTTFYYTSSGTTVSTLSRAIFALSVSEFGKSPAYANVEGSALPIASKLLIAYLEGVAVEQWTRSPVPTNTVSACRIDTSGTPTMSWNGCTLSHGSRPAFTIPSTATFDPDTLLFKEAA